MSANIDRSLDEVISSRRTNRRGFTRRGSGIAKSSLVGSRPPRPPRMSSGSGAAGVPPHTTDKIIVSNLPTDVNETQIRELFTQMIGPLREVTLTYDANGMSKGIASVVFSRHGDAAKAYDQYHNRLIDGKRPMKIEIVVDPRRAGTTVPSLTARVGGFSNQTGQTATSNNTVRSGEGFRRGGRGRGRGGRRQNDRPTKSLEDLDAEMEDYTQSAPDATSS